MSTQDSKNDRASWLKGPSSNCSVPPANPARPWRVVLLGAPGVGKGTQAELLVQRLEACHLSTGDVFRAAKSLSDCERSPAMTQALEYMRKGELVPDAIVLDMIRERVSCLCCQGGFLLDGFPRTVAQAEALGQILREQQIQLNGVLNYELPLDEIVSRISGRRTCSGCKAVFHVTGRPPKVEGTCDACGKALFQREDDRPEAVRVRMEAYEKSTRPLIDFYRKQGLLISIQAAGTPEEIFNRTMSVLDKKA